MTVSFIGAIVVLVGIFLLWKSPLAMLCYVMVCTLFGGSAAIALPALGGSTVPPGHVALGFLFVRVAIAIRKDPRELAWSVNRNWAIVLFAVYGLAAAMTLPHLFQGGIELTPQSGRGNGNMFYMAPLRPSPQNITQGVYVMGTAVAAVLASVVARDRRMATTLPALAIWLGGLHVSFGLIDLISGMAHVDVLSIFRNAQYSQLEQSVGGFHRIAGVLPEASTYAGTAGVLLIMNTELWLRDAKALTNGVIAAALAFMMIICTSSTGYFMLLVYAAVLLARFLLVPGAGDLKKIVVLLLAGLAAVNLVLLTVQLAPQFAESVWRVIADMTINKGSSFSAVQRSFWSQQGWDAFVFSKGLGVGPGSFRSSSLFTAVLGATGIVGIVSLSIYVFEVLAPFRATTYRLLNNASFVGPSASWAAVLGLAAGLITSPAPDPGIAFGILSGIALGLRGRAEQTSVASEVRYYAPLRWGLR